MPPLLSWPGRPSRRLAAVKPHPCVAPSTPGRRRLRPALRSSEAARGAACGWAPLENSLCPARRVRPSWPAGLRLPPCAFGALRSALPLASRWPGRGVPPLLGSWDLSRLGCGACVSSLSVAPVGCRPGLPASRLAPVVRAGFWPAERQWPGLALGLATCSPHPPGGSSCLALVRLPALVPARPPDPRARFSPSRLPPLRCSLPGPGARPWAQSAGRPWPAPEINLSFPVARGCHRSRFLPPFSVHKLLINRPYLVYNPIPTLFVCA